MLHRYNKDKDGKIFFIAITYKTLSTGTCQILSIFVIITAFLLMRDSSKLTK